MTCREAEELILESIDLPLDHPRQHALDAHAAGCAQCRQFRQTQLALDDSLVSHFAAATLSAEFELALQQRVAAERRRAMWEYAPDLLHLSGGLAGSLVCAWLLPFSASVVIAAGLAFTVVAYFFQVLLRSMIEEL